MSLANSQHFHIHSGRQGRSLSRGPEREVGLLLSGRESCVSDFKHIEIYIRKRELDTHMQTTFVSPFQAPGFANCVIGTT